MSLDHASIARAVHSVTFIPNPRSGACCEYAMLGYRVLQHLGFEPAFCIGSVQHRVGDGGGDVIGWYPSKKHIGHMWLRVGDDLVDFSPISWRRVLRVPKYLRWTVQTPDYIWGPWEELADPDIHHSWTLGATWYREETHCGVPDYGKFIKRTQTAFEFVAVDLDDAASS